MKQTQEPITEVVKKKAVYVAPRAEVRELRLEQVYLNVNMSSGVPGGTDHGGDLGDWGLESVDNGSTTF